MLQSTLPYIDLGGTIRSQSLAATMNLITPHLSTFGITRVANVTGLDCIGIPVAVSIRPNAKHLSVSQGKGINWELAKVSALMESIEGYHAENPAAPDFTGDYATLHTSYPLAHPQQLAPGNITLTDITKWPMPWIRAIDLFTQQPIFIPHALICLDSTIPHPEYNLFAINSNGLASGNELNEAICHAICEIIERDALCRWGASNEAARNSTQLQLESIQEPVIQQVITQFANAKQAIKIWDITSAIGIPSFHCMISDLHPWRSLGSFRGTGTHLSKQVALLRALTEAAQSRLTVISGSRDDVFLDHYQQRSSQIPDKQDAMGEKDYATCVQPDMAMDFGKNLQYLLQQLQTKGYTNVWMVNHTKPEFTIPVVHVFIPGMKFTGSRM